MAAKNARAPALRHATRLNWLLVPPLEQRTNSFLLLVIMQQDDVVLHTACISSIAMASPTLHDNSDGHYQRPRCGHQEHVVEQVRFGHEAPSPRVPQRSHRCLNGLQDVADELRQDVQPLLPRGPRALRAATAVARARGSSRMTSTTKQIINCQATRSVKLPAARRPDRHRNKPRVDASESAPLAA